MLYTYAASKKKNSETQILTGTIKEVNDQTVVVTTPIGYNNVEEYTIAKADIPNVNAKVGAPIVAFGLDDGDKHFDIDTEMQAKLNRFATQMLEFDRCKQKAEGKPMEHDVMVTFTLNKSTQVRIDKDKKTVAIPASAGNTTVWLQFNDKSKFNHFENYKENGKDRLGYGSYAQMLQKKLDNLKEDDTLFLTYVGRFEAATKDAEGNYMTGEDGKMAFSPLTPTEKDGKLTYYCYCNGEQALGTLLNTAIEVPKSLVYVKSNTQAQAADAAPANPSVADETPAEVAETTSAEELELMQALGQ